MEQQYGLTLGKLCRDPNRSTYARRQKLIMHDLFLITPNEWHHPFWRRARLCYINILFLYLNIIIIILNDSNLNDRLL